MLKDMADEIVGTVAGRGLEQVYRDAKSERNEAVERQAHDLSDRMDAKKG